MPEQKAAPEKEAWSHLNIRTCHYSLSHIPVPGIKYKAQKGFRTTKSCLGLNEHANVSSRTESNYIMQY